MILEEAALLARQQAAARVAAESYARAIRAEFGGRVEKIRLYGSLARGEWLGPEEADIDVAVLLRGLVRADEMRLVELAGELSRGCGMVISPRAFSPEEFAGLLARERALALDIEREGVTL